LLHLRTKPTPISALVAAAVSADGAAAVSEGIRRKLACQAFEDRCPAADSYVAVGQSAASFEHGHAVVKVHRQGGMCKFSGRQRIPRPLSVQFIDEPFADFDECAFAFEATTELIPISRVKIFDEVHAVGRSSRVKKSKSFNDVVHPVATVVEDYIGRSEFRDDVFKETRVGLAADANFDLVFLEGFALRVHVNSNDQRMGAKVALPHLRRPAAAASDLKKNCGPVDEPAEVSLVDGKIVLPLVYCSLLIIDELGPQAQSTLAFDHAACEVRDAVADHPCRILSTANKNYTKQPHLSQIRKNNTVLEGSLRKALAGQGVGWPEWDLERAFV
jgi:hypothetical protein